MKSICCALAVAIASAGLQSGKANGMAGGRTDVGPLGGTGIPDTLEGEHERARAIANDQARGPNAPGSLLRPADTPPQINLHPRAMGSGAPSLPTDEHY